MKSLFVAISLLLSSASWAKETVTIVFAFGPGDNVANYSRALIAEANRIQNNYTFIFEAKPGAGGTIAANHVAKTPNSILATSAAFFVRPTVYPNDSHRVGDFRSILPQCEAPMAIGSGRYARIQDIPADQPLTIGIGGLGAVSHIVALEFKQKFVNTTIVPFKSPVDSTAAVVGRQIDFNVGFAGEMEQFMETKGLKILGQTGNNPKRYPVLGNDGLPSVLKEMNNPQHLVVPSNIPEERFQAWRRILYNAAKSPQVKERYAADFCEPLDHLDDRAIAQWYTVQSQRWHRLAAAVKLD